MIIKYKEYLKTVIDFVPLKNIVSEDETKTSDRT